MRKQGGVFGTLWILYFIGKFYGMTTFTYVWKDERKVMVQFYDIVRLVSFLVFYIILLALNYSWSIVTLESDETFSIFCKGMRCLLMYSNIMVIFTVIYNFRFRKQLFNIIVKIDDHDTEVSFD